MLAAMHKYVNINPEEFPAALVERLQLQRLLPLAIDRAIFENLPALSERASSVACNTTAELILKVFSQSFHSSNLSLVSSSTVLQSVLGKQRMYGSGCENWDICLSTGHVATPEVVH